MGSISSPFQLFCYGTTEDEIVFGLFFFLGVKAYVVSMWLGTISILALLCLCQRRYNKNRI